MEEAASFALSAGLEQLFTYLFTGETSSLRRAHGI
jgi:hypothetical protein